MVKITDHSEFLSNYGVSTSTALIPPCHGHNFRLVGDRWPSLRGRTLRKIVEKHCGPPVRHGKHPTYRNVRGQLFQFGYHDQRDVTGDMVRRILIVDVGLDEDVARKEAR